MTHLSYYWHFLNLGTPKKAGKEARNPAFRFFIGYFSSHFILANTLYYIKPSRSTIIDLSQRDAQEESSSTVEMGQGCNYLRHDLSSFTESVRMLKPTEDHDCIDIWNGYSNELMTLIGNIATLRNDARALLQLPKASHFSEMSMVTQKIKHFKTSLDQIKQCMPATITDHEFFQQQTAVKLIQIRAETYHVAAILLLHESSKPSFYGKSSQYCLLEHIPLLSLHSINSYRSAMFDSVSLILQSPSLPFEWGLWPLFIAACYAYEEEDKAQALDLFHTAQCKTPFENIHRAQKVTELHLLNWKPSFT